MTPEEIESMSSLQNLLQMPADGLYIDIYSGPEALQLHVSNSWFDLSQLSFIKNMSDSDDLVSGYNLQASINQGIYLYVFPGKGRGNLTIDQYRQQLGPKVYSNSGSSSSSSSNSSISSTSSSNYCKYRTW